MEEDTQLKDIFPELERYLFGAGAPLRAAESHGLLCARYCMQDKPDFSVWADEVLGDQDARDLSTQTCYQQLSAVYQMTDNMFDTSLGGITLLLPDDQATIQTRGNALVDWCSGFIAGLGLAGLHDETEMDTDVQEVLKDLTEITHLEEHIGESEENEQAFMEIVEYVRVAVMTVGLAMRNRDISKTLH